MPVLVLVLYFLSLLNLPTTTLLLGQGELGHAEGVPESNIAAWPPLLVRS